ncbi:holo-ACP synthase [Nitrogeniibacter mangrovi]|uniref:Holo-[acyl-carrier-protein] synthase n=1 Tax=Nitrogeniibacter mangrovi TaxID=2016596 RepID=A0A6C1B2B0_9RHOO|nr:holo-ACP synthase [Nitrogeniibacter mangrovi]QID17776.1 holo-ACP synthase [Nitrogeniibacter mangrovi]
MIFGIGTDLVSIARVEAALERSGPRFAERILAPSEREAFASATHPARLLAKRFAAKEAFGKAFGTGVVAPATLHSVAVSRDERGKPHYDYHGDLARIMDERQLRAHLSITDEQDYVVAFAVIESAA